MELLVLILILAGTCDSGDEEPLFPADVGVGGSGGAAGAGGNDAATSASAAGGEGGTGGEGGAGVGGEAGAGGAPCEPTTEACGDALCGEADDGCGGKVSCGACSPGDRCFEGACCAPARCEPGRCGVQDDGCGGMISCGDVCGDGSGWMTCGEAGWCECTSAEKIEAGEYGEAHCQATDAGHAFACGEPRNTEGELYDDVPGGCKYIQVTIGVGGPRLWCCE